MVQLEKDLNVYHFLFSSKGKPLLPTSLLDNYREKEKLKN
jgi:hypothetical protein